MKDLKQLYIDVNDETLLDFSPNDINLGKDNYSCDQIVEMLENDEINLATIFQRRAGLWTEVQKSKFIESMMLRFPIPPLYFNVVFKDEEKQYPFWEVIDGLQRLYTIKEFVHGVNGKKLKLQGLDFYPELDGLSFDDLPRHLVRNFKACQLQLHLVYPQTPIQVILRIFERINTTSLKLTDQEVRNAIYQGPIVDILKKDSDFLEVNGIRINDKRSSNNEVVLRFYSVYCFGIDNYMKLGSLSDFLDKSMRVLNELNGSELNIVSEKFRNSLKVAFNLFGERAFRGKGNRFNRTIFEAKLVTIAMLSEREIEACIKQKDSILMKYDSLINFKSPESDRFIKSVSNATSRPDNVKYRYEMMKLIISGDRS